MALTTWNLPQYARLVGVLLDAVNDVSITLPDEVPAGPSFFRFADDTEFESLLKNQGFVGIGIQTIEFAQRVDDADELWDGLLHGTVRTSAVIRGQTADVVREIRASFDRRVNEYRVGEKYDLPVSFKLASARRGQRHGAIE